MKTKGKKCIPAAVTAAPKKGRPIKVYTIKDAVRMVRFGGKRSVQTSPWRDAKLDISSAVS
jgi:hypothetical protein